MSIVPRQEIFVAAGKLCQNNKTNQTATAARRFRDHRFNAGDLTQRHLKQSDLKQSDLKQGR